MAVPVIAGLSKATGFVQTVTELRVLIELLQNASAADEAAGALTRLSGDLATAVHGYGARRFRKLWVRARLLVGLQSRLFIEQVLWELGGPFRDLVTGFRPVTK